jgi:NCS1 family nucleobase:cation symporter-1
MRPVDLAPIGPEEQTSAPLDLFLIFVGANIVATTLQVGASLPGSFTATAAFLVIGAGVVCGSVLTGVLAPVGSRLRVPSIVATRAALGVGGAQALALLLFVTNFAWIALNNVIAASITAQVTGIGTTSVWSAGLGVTATVIVLGGPRAAAVVDRVAVPLLMTAGAVFTIAVLRAPTPAWPTGPVPAGDLTRGLDIVIGYQASWLLMFADYPRFVRSPRAAGWAVFLGLALTSLWFMPLGLVASVVAGSSDPGAMVTALQLGAWGALLVAVAALTTNFVNIYMSALALKSLRPSLGGAAGVWIIGGIGAALGLFSMGWLERFASFTLVLASCLVPVGGLLLAHFLVLKAPTHVPDLYTDVSGRAAWSGPGLLAWIVGVVTFHVAAPIGGTLPSLVATMATYLALWRRSAPSGTR